MSERITLPRADDWHLHLRDGAALRAVAGFSAARFARALIMPNLDPPVTTAAMALSYRARILAALPPAAQFEPLMTLYLTDTTPAGEIARARASGCIVGCKLYPAGATTHAHAGVTDPARLEPLWQAMSDAGLVLEVHGEVADTQVDVFDRERVFIERVLVPLAERWPRLRIVLEHVSTRDAVQFVQGARRGIGATITPQHLLFNRNALLAGGLRPHLYCNPVLKREPDRRALLEAVAGADARFFLGTDSAPHARADKESACGCAGVFSAHAALELYAEAFRTEGILARLPDFASRFGADFYGVPRNGGEITLLEEAWTVPTSYAFGGQELVPLRAGERVGWRLQ